MKILHTSDWHLGRPLYGQRRHAEFAAFLEWLGEILERERIEALLVAGDIFDTTTPGNRAQELYYRFLCRAAAGGCRQIVITAGNHDSPTFLEAPKELLKALDVHVIGSGSENPDNELIILKGPDGRPELLVAAVPYLRDREIRTAEPGETIEDKERKLVEGIRDHYAKVAAAARRRLEQMGYEIPVVAMGHLFTRGGKILDGDGVRRLYIGSLAPFPADCFPDLFTYIALGHLHQPQTVGDNPTIRYSGSPLAHGFSEAGRRKEVLLVDFQGCGEPPAVTPLPVPVFQPLEALRGDLETILARIAELKAEPGRAWLEITYDGKPLAGNLHELLAEAVARSDLKILNLRNQRLIESYRAAAESDETLEELTLDEVFERCLESHAVPEAQRPVLQSAFQEIITALHEDDPGAEV
ncbi:MAG: exonuclease SbcCD subunit D C-terminal domain-containing protein [Deltaproteobacteria bacterium]|nr:exonuclease SbcCD subunit D C-terminal domain-containing protein [Deltaproteobacteria bacterium]